MERRLAAIVSADVVGYSRLIDLDEAGTHARVMALLEGIAATVTKRGGRIVKTTGDGALVIFDSVIDAVECSVATQRDAAAIADDVPADQRLNLRIGVNLGDIILDSGDVYGQGVNVAVRLQQIAKSGAVYVSRAVAEHARNSTEVHFDLVGKLALKNIIDPVDVFSAVPGAAVGTRAVVSPKRRNATRWGVAGLVAVLGALLVAGIYWLQSSGNSVQRDQIASVAPAVPREDSIAVLPFADLGGDRDSKLIVDGVFDDLITDLSKLSELTVLAANAVAPYRGQETGPMTVANELAVRYVLEGSIRRIDESLRINVRLIDSRAGRNVWAQSYSGLLSDIFDFQENMVENVVSSLAVTVSEPERARILARETASVPAYESFRRGQAALLLKTPENLPIALAEFRKAIQIDPSYSQAFAGIGQVYWNAWVWGWEASVGETSDTAPGLTNQYLKRALERPTAAAYQLASDVSLYARKFDDSLHFAQLAVEFAPNDPASHMVMAEALIYGGRAGEAMPWIEAANRLASDASKQAPAYNVWVLGMAFFGEEKFEEAVPLFEDALRRNPQDFGPAAPLAAAYRHLAEKTPPDTQSSLEYQKKAEAALRIYLAGSPDASIQEVQVYWPFRDDEDRQRLIEPLRALGMKLAL